MGQALLVLAQCSTLCLLVLAVSTALKAAGYGNWLVVTAAVATLPLLLYVIAGFGMLLYVHNCTRVEIGCDGLQAVVQASRLQAPGARRLSVFSGVRRVAIPYADILRVRVEGRRRRPPGGLRRPLQVTLDLGGRWEGQQLLLRDIDVELERLVAELRVRIADSLEDPAGGESYR